MAKKRQGMLSPYRVLDLTDEKGHLGGKLLGDLGADVIKVEKPGGDDARNIGPFYHDEEDPEKSLSWFAFNTSKRGITLDVETVEGQDVFKNLVKSADVVLESFPPGYLHSLGLGYDGLEKIRRQIVMVSINPFGQTGPYKDYKAPGIVAWAMGGFMSRFGDADRPPVQVSHYPQAYLLAAAASAAGAMMGLYHRQREGEGQHIDISIQECAAQCVEFQAILWDMMKVIQPRGQKQDSGFLHSWTVYIFIMPVYLSYFVLLEDLIVRFRLRDYHLLVAGFFVGTIIVPFASGAAIRPPLTFGINWAGLFFINLLWWGPLQFALAMYLANRLAPRDWNHSRLGVFGWIFFTLLFAAALGSIHVGKYMAAGISYEFPVTPSGCVTLCILLLSSGIFFWRILPRPNAAPLSHGRAIGTLSAVASITLLILAAVIMITLLMKTLPAGEAAAASVATDANLFFQTSFKLTSLTTILYCLVLSVIIVQWLFRRNEATPAPLEFKSDIVYDMLALLTCFGLTQE